MKTKITKQVENLAFERYSTWTIVTHLYRRHEVGILYSALFLSWTLSAMDALRVI